MNANAKNEEKYNLTGHHVNPAARISSGGIAFMQKNANVCPHPANAGHHLSRTHHGLAPTMEELGIYTLSSS